MTLFLAIAASILALSFIVLWWRCQTRLTSVNQDMQSLLDEKKIFFDFMHEIGESFTEELGRQQLLDRLLDAVMRVTHSQSGAIFVSQNHPSRLEVATSRGFFPPPVSLSPEVWARAVQGPEKLQAVMKEYPVLLDQSSALAKLFQDGEALLLSGEEARSFFPPARDPEYVSDSLLLVTLKYRGDHLGILAVAHPRLENGFTPSDLELVKSIAAQSAFSLHHDAVYRQLAEKKQLDRDLQVARDIQQILLPTRCPEIAGYDISAVNLPAKYVSGDYFDFIPVDEHRWGFVVADVSGKGVPASLIMAMCRSVLRTQAPACKSAQELLCRVNRILFPDLRNDMFITLVYAILDTRSHTLTIAKAGHDAPLFRQASNGVIRLLQSPGMVLGIDSGDVFDMVIQDLVVPLQPGDTLLFYTDGVNEAMDENGREFGRDPLLDSLRNSSAGGPAAITVNIVDRVTRFRGAAAQSDDITILSLQRK